jgi:hypothetical protein
MNWGERPWSDARTRLAGPSFLCERRPLRFGETSIQQLKDLPWVYLRIPKRLTSRDTILWFTGFYCVRRAAVIGWAVVHQTDKDARRTPQANLMPAPRYFSDVRPETPTVFWRNAHNSAATKRSQQSAFATPIRDRHRRGRGRLRTRNGGTHRGTRTGIACDVLRAVRR